MAEEEKTQVFCLKCYQTIAEHIYLQDCEHRFCFQCIIPKADTFTCPKCRTNSTFKIKPGINTVEKCLICDENTSQQGLDFSCSHRFCQQCVVTYWIQQLAEGNFRRLTQFVCPHCQQSQPFSQTRIYSLIPKQYFIKLIDKNKYQFLSRCPNCQLIFNPSNIKQIVCPHCTTFLCKVCRQIQQQDHICRQSYVGYVVHYLKIDIRYCPNCNQPCNKSSGCDHVKCYQCGKYFCYFCMVDYRAIEKHGNSRHRRGCRNWKKDECKKDCDCKFDCGAPEESLEEYVDRKKYVMQKRYLAFKSAAGYEIAEEELNLADLFDNF